MLLQINYLIRSKNDGKYLVARISQDDDRAEAAYLLVFQADHEALSYINTHGKEMSDRLDVESVSPMQLKSLLQRWGYQGIGVVKDPLLPDIEFLTV